jgi:hypothetical protein
LQLGGRHLAGRLARERMAPVLQLWLARESAARSPICLDSDSKSTQGTVDLGLKSKSNFVSDFGLDLDLEVWFGLWFGLWFGWTSARDNRRDPPRGSKQVNGPAALWWPAFSDIWHSLSRLLSLRIRSRIRFNLVLDSVFAPEADCAVVEHGEAVTKATRVLCIAGVNRG